MFLNFKNRYRKQSGQEMAEWWFIITAVSLLVMFTLLKWGEVQSDVMNTLNTALESVNNSVSTTGSST